MTEGPRRHKSRYDIDTIGVQGVVDGVGAVMSGFQRLTRRK